MIKLKGQIQVGLVIGWGVAIGLAMVGGFVSQNRITETKIDALRTENQGKIEKVQNDITTVKINIALICQKLNIKCKD